MRLCFGEFVLDDTARQLIRDGEPVHLTPKAFELLELLIASRPRAVSKTEFHRRLWPGTHVTESNLPVLIHELREVLGDDPHEPRWVRTVARFGYSFCGEVQQAPTESGENTSPWDCRILWGGREILLRMGENVLGRTHEAAVWVDDASVSRHHAVIRVSDGGATLEDSGSRNGTFLRGQRIDGAVPLQDGDEFVLGGVLLTFRAFRRDGLDGASRSTAPLFSPLEPEV
jgi:DNA-binding winged helix-turn-helix (wHTH) protein